MFGQRKEKGTPVHTYYIHIRTTYQAIPRDIGLNPLHWHFRLTPPTTSVAHIADLQKLRCIPIAQLELSEIDIWFPPLLSLFVCSGCWLSDRRFDHRSPSCAHLHSCHRRSVIGQICEIVGRSRDSISATIHTSSWHLESSHLDRHWPPTTVRRGWMLRLRSDRNPKVCS